MSLVSAWSPLFQSGARMRGRAYQLEGRVKRLPPTNGELVRAEVRGQQPYTVVIRREGEALTAECTCPAFEKGMYCKHVWATLLDIQQSEGPGASASELSGLAVRPPRARRRAGSAPRVEPAAEPRWMGRLSLVRASGGDSPASGESLLPAQRQVCYMVLVEASRQAGGVVVELRHRSPTATGWSRPKPLRLTPQVLSSIQQATDRELCALLLGGTWVDDAGWHEPSSIQRSQARFRLPIGARRSLLKRMCATGRCFVEHEEAPNERERRLRWDGDEPWVLWLRGTEAEDELLVHLELRRGEQRLGIERPELVVGGPDGIVIEEQRAAPFDDRDATRWHAQFRDEVRRAGAAEPLRVPRQDIGRFLDRLYTLPQLPELDLPPGVGHTAEHIRPVPRLDLYSPGSTQASRWLPSSTRNMLAARLAFTYGDQVVDPTQPGRFVSLNVEQASSTDRAGEGADQDAEAIASDEAGGRNLSETEAETAPEAPVAEVVSEGTRDAEASEPHAALAQASGEAEAEQRLIRRDHPAEQEAFATLASLGFRPVSQAPGDVMMLPVRRMPAAVSRLLELGWTVRADEQAVRRAGPPKLSISSGIDWFELHGNVTYRRADGSEQAVSLPQILAAARAGKRMIALDDGTTGLLPMGWLREHGLLTALGKVEDDHLRFRSSQAAMLDALVREQDLMHVDETFARARERLHRFEGITPLAPAPAFHGELRAYQRDGLGWFRFLREFGMGGILADDMGLGKTIQVLAMLQARKLGVPGHGDEQTASGNGSQAAGQAASLPSLVVAPRSVVFNWADEAQRFTPELRVLAYAGAERTEWQGRFGEFDLIVTSYGLLRRDIDLLREQPFDYAVLDEAQAIKNPGSQSAKAARLLDARHRLALTGTPVENHLGDLWSIFEFLNPGMLGASSRFNELVRMSQSKRQRLRPAATGGGADAAQAGGHRDTLQQIAAALRPFVLRRTKKQVLADLPEKTEQTIACEMEPAQRRVYDELRDYYRAHLFRQIDATGPAKPADAPGVLGGGNAFVVLEALLRLRQVACHPALVDPKRADEPSAKLEALIEQLEEVVEEGHKALVFSQFTSMLAIVRRRLDQQNIPYAYLDGQTRDRRQVVERFQTDPAVPVFLISLKAGGFGLNLTAAEYVFILDPWWNPAVEQQAIDRTHRIGQTRKVFAYRLICRDTVEQRIIELQQRKRELADAIIDGQDNLLRSLTRDDLERLLS